MHDSQGNKILNNGMRRMAFKVFLLCLPVLLLVASYFILDPFRILYSYSYGDNYYDLQPYELNREFISTESLLLNYPEYHYDSFIMGSCESYVYHAEDWSKHIHNKGEIFHYPAASESLFGVWSKVKFLDEQKIPINHCLLVMDNSTFIDTEPRSDYLHSAHPEVWKGSGLSFHVNMLKSYFSNFFCIQYLDYRLTGKIKGYMKNNFAIAPGQIRTNVLNNEYYYAQYDDAIAADSVLFYSKNARTFYVRDTTTEKTLLSPVILSRQQEMLHDVREIFDRHHTDFSIILSPMYDQVKMNYQDVTVLSEIFGGANVFDFSGRNNMTDNIYNYYDSFHYKPHLAREILQVVYGKTENAQTD